MLLPFASKMFLCNIIFSLLYTPLHPSSLLLPLSGCLLGFWVFLYTLLINVNPNLQPDFFFTAPLVQSLDLV